MKREITVNGKRFSLDAAIAAGEITFRNGSGETCKASAIETEPGRYSILIGGRSYDVRPGAAGVFVDGRHYAVEVADPREMAGDAAAGGADGGYSLKSQMPGKVVRVLVSEGDRVEAGQGIVVMEAMKMQNELKTRRGGVVSRVAAREGATVTAGELLAVVE